MTSITIVTPPAIEPIGLAQANDHVKADTTDVSDAEITMWIQDARVSAETFLDRALLTQTIDVTLDDFPGSQGTIWLPRPPLQSITSITYTDDLGVPTVLSSSLYDVDTASDPGRVVPAYGESWPSTRNVVNAVTIRAVVGYGEPADIPAPIRSAMLLTISDRYDNRGTLVVGTIVSRSPQTAQNLLAPFRNYRGTSGI